jgi:hypothetical protein
MLNGDAHLSEIEGEQARIRPVALRFQRLDREGEYHMSILVSG